MGNTHEVMAALIFIVLVLVLLEWRECFTFKVLSGDPSAISCILKFGFMSQKTIIAP